jgi:predicted peptidase
MSPFLLLAVMAALAQQAAPPRIEHQAFSLPDGTSMLYALAVPRGEAGERGRPLILALHPGGERTPYRGSTFLRGVVAPALNTLGAIIVAPDCPTRSWSDPAAEQAVLALLDRIAADHHVDRQRVLVTGFSLGGAGTWFMASRHADRFTAAIPMAGRIADPSLEGYGAIPTYIIHSRADEVVPFEPAERAARELERLGRPVRFEAVTGVGHFQMGGYVEALRRAGAWVSETWSAGSR